MAVKKGGTTGLLVLYLSCKDKGRFLFLQVMS